MILDFESAKAEEAPTTEKVLLQALKENLKSGAEASIRRHGRAEDAAITIEGCAVFATPGHLNLIAEELVDNACKFSRKGTRITVHFGPDAVLTITDAGRGMSPEEIAQVGSFQQFDRKKHEQQGLGLGLALVQKLAARCGATLSIASQPSQGTTVKVAFRPATAT